MIPNYEGIISPMKSLNAMESRKTVGVRGCPVGGNKSQLTFIYKKMSEWINRTRNGHLTPHMGWLGKKMSAMAQC